MNPAFSDEKNQFLELTPPLFPCKTMGFQWFSYDLLVKISDFSTAEATNVEEAEMRLALEMSLMSVEAGESMGKW